MRTLGRTVSREEFIKAINKWAKRTGAPEISSRMLEDWNEEGLFPGALPVPTPDQQQPSWRYETAHFRRAILLCSLKKRGFERYSILRVMVWLSGKNIPGGPPRLDLVSEFSRIRNSLLRQISSTYNPAISISADDRRGAVLAKQLGPQAEVFQVHPLKLEPSESVEAYVALRYGGSARVFDNKLNETFAELFPDLNLADFERLVPRGVISGVLGSPDEIDHTAVSDLANVTDQKLEEARSSYLRLLKLMKALQRQQTLNGTLSAAIAAFSHVANDPQWRLTIFISVFIAEVRTDKPPPTA